MSGPALTAEIEHQILSYLRAGGFPQIAAEAAGVPKEVFADWLRRGEAPRGARRYRAFARSVRQAQAQARLTAEIAVLREKPLDWLRSGPGKQRVDSPGWTAPVRAALSAQERVELLPGEVQQILLALFDQPMVSPEDRVRAAEMCLKQAGRGE